MVAREARDVQRVRRGREKKTASVLRLLKITMMEEMIERMIFPAAQGECHRRPQPLIEPAPDRPSLEVAVDQGCSD